MGRGWDAWWLGDSVEFGESLKMDRVRRTQRRGVRGGRLTRRDENCNRIKRQDCLCLVTLDWSAITRPLQTRFLGGRGQGLVATATWSRDSVRVYDSQNGRVLVEFPIKVNSFMNQSLTWASDNK